MQRTKKEEKGSVVLPPNPKEKEEPLARVTAHEDGAQGLSSWAGVNY